MPIVRVSHFLVMKNDLPMFGARPSASLPMPARYMIDLVGMILRGMRPDYLCRPEPEDTLRFKSGTGDRAAAAIRYAARKHCDGLR
jgi:hypothetical protein